jgi:hypothetical protein
MMAKWPNNTQLAKTIRVIKESIHSVADAVRSGGLSVVLKRKKPTKG